MIDTIVAWFSTPTTRPGRAWLEERKEAVGGQHTFRYILNTELAQLTLGTDRRNPGRFVVQASLPKIIQGHNITAIKYDDLRTACDQLHKHVAQAARAIAVPALKDWRLTRVDWPYSWQVKSPSLYISSLRKTVKVGKAQQQHGWHEGRFHGCTLVISSKRGLKEMIYDKEAEVREALRSGMIDLARCELTTEQILKLAQGRLRYEVVTKRAHLIKILRTPRPTVGHLLPYIKANGVEFLADRWEQRTRNWEPVSEEVAAQELIAAYGDRVAADLAAFRFYVGSIGLEEYRRKF